MKQSNKHNSNENEHNMNGNKTNQFDALWLELEPRLKQPKRNRKFLWLFLFIGILALSSIAYYNFNLINNPTTTAAEQITNSNSNSDKHSAKAVKEEGVTETLVTQELNITSSDSQRTKNITKSNTQLSSNKENQTKYNKSIQRNHIDRSTLITAANTQRAKQNVAQSQTTFYKESTPQSIATQQVLPLEKRILNSDTIPSKATRIERLKMVSSLSEIQIMPLILSRPLAYFNKANFKLKQISRQSLKVQKNSKFGLTAYSLMLINMQNKVDQPTSYHSKISESLSIDKGVQLGLGAVYQLSSNLELGLDVNYTQIYETFRLQNQIETEQLVSHPQAFSVNDEFLAAEKHLPATIFQDIQHNNYFANISLVPNMEYNFSLSSLQFGFGFGLPIIFAQDYNGTLFDEIGLRTYDSPILQAKRFKTLGLKLSQTVSIPITDRINLGSMISYQRWNGQTDSTTGFIQSNANTLGLGMHLGFDF